MAGFEIWLVAAIILFIGEMFTAGFFLMWFGVGGLVACLAALLGVGDDVAQSVIFLVSSAILVVLSRPLADKMTKTAPRAAAVDALIGKTAIVIEEINPDSNTGRVRVGKEEWRADSKDVISLGGKVRVVGVEGTHLLVENI